MAQELIAEFDPFLAKHIEIYGNKRKGNTSYLSFQTCEEFISIMEERMVKYIVDEVKEGKYFSTILDQWRTQEFFLGGWGVQQIQLRTERTGIWGR